MQIHRQLWPARFDNPPAEHDVRHVGPVVLEQVFVVRDDQNAHVLAADVGDALAGQPHRVDVEAAVGFIQDGELGPQHRQLQDFGPFHFAAGKTVVHVAAGKLLVHPQLFHLLRQFFTELAHRNQLFAFLALRPANVGDRVPQEVSHLHARNGHRPLKRQENARAGTLAGIHRQHVVAALFVFQRDRALGDDIARVPHDGVSQRALSRAVGSHQGVDFSALDLQVHAAQDLLAVGSRHAQIVDFQGFSHLGS